MFPTIGSKHCNHHVLLLNNKLLLCEFIPCLISDSVTDTGGLLINIHLIYLLGWLKFCLLFVLMANTHTFELLAAVFYWTGRCYVILKLEVPSVVQSKEVWMCCGNNLKTLSGSVCSRAEICLLLSALLLSQLQWELITHKLRRMFKADWITGCHSLCECMSGFTQQDPPRFSDKVITPSDGSKRPWFCSD